MAISIAPKVFDIPNRMGEIAKIRRIFETMARSSLLNPGATRILIELAKMAMATAEIIIMLVAALMAEGESEITGVEHIDRGYEAIDLRLKEVGADIRRV